MIKGYRKHFVLFNMLLVGAVLIIALVAQWIFLYKSSYNEMKNTMRLVVEPWGRQGPKMRAALEGPDGQVPGMNEDGSHFGEQAPEMNEAAEGSGGQVPGMNEDAEGSDGQVPGMNEDTEGSGGQGIPGDRARANDENILTVFYDKVTDEIMILPDDTSDESGSIRKATDEIIALGESFGYLNDSGYYFYMESNPGHCKIALAESSFLSSRILGNTLVLILVFVVSMGLVLIISIRLAKLAARPMEDAIEQERRFVANISHDLKTPITVILANNSILRDNRGLSDDEREQWFESTDTAAKNMMSLIGEMLELSSLESAEKKPAMTRVSLSDAAQKASLQLESLAFERSVTMDCDIEENVNILGTPEYVERICSSLFENALKYEPDGGRVRFALRRERRHAVLTAANFGSVIDPEDMDHIFERFYRGDKARDVRTGHGLGLPILKELTQTLGGEIAAASSKEEGTVFTLRFETVS